MAARPKKSKTLHNFTLPGDLRWGYQRFPPCIKVNSAAQISSIHDTSHFSDKHHHRRNFIQPPSTAGVIEKNSSSQFFRGSHTGIESIREKLLFDLQTAAIEMKDAIFKGSDSPAASEEGGLDRLLNLRKRRAACKRPASKFVSSTADGGGVNNTSVGALKSNSGPSHTPAVEKSAVLKHGNLAAERRKFAVALSREEIEEDFFAMVGRRPARRPKKRRKIVQRQLDSLFPGLWLTEVTADMYEVAEAVS